MPPKIMYVRLHVFPGTPAQDAVDFAINMACGMSMARVEFEFNGRQISVDHHAKTRAILRVKGIKPKDIQQFKDVLQTPQPSVRELVQAVTEAQKKAHSRPLKLD